MATSDDDVDLNDVDQLIARRHGGDESSRQRAKTFRRPTPRRLTAIVTAVIIAVVCVAIVVGLVVAFHKKKHTSNSGNPCTPTKNEEKFDCHPDGNPNQKECLKRGCCWKETRDPSPSCFYPANMGSKYRTVGLKQISGGLRGIAEWDGDVFPFQGLVTKLNVSVKFETASRLHARIADAENARYEVELDVPAGDDGKLSSGDSPTAQDYVFNYIASPFGFSVTRKSTGETLFNTTVGRFVFADQFIQMSARLPTLYVYGFGEHVQGNNESTVTQRVDVEGWRKLTLFSRDISPEDPMANLYGVHPFFLGMDSSNKAYGVFLKNSNAMDVQLQPLPAVTYRTIGGILDFYFFMGPTPEEVVQQYIEVIGRPILPPYWALGFHLCRWGYNSSNNTWDVVKAMRDNGIPQDVQWNDIDYMHVHLDFTYNHTTYSSLPEMVNDLHNHGQKYIMIVDPGISNEQLAGDYPPYDRGMEMGIFVNVSSNESTPILGKVWPDITAYPDFTNPSCHAYWQEMVENFHRSVSFDGLWIDMNEPSNFVPGSTNGCPVSLLNNPPYQPGSLGGKLYDKTLCMSSQQYASLHYNVHSLYGHTEAIATSSALKSVLKKRSLVISRSTFPGTGQHAGHWLGDNQSTWPDLARSIPGILDFSLFGIPLVGADICGFGQEPDEELCIRWMQLGAFYPFSRNHNSINMKSQDPTAFSKPAMASMRNALLLRYSLLPYLYTLFYRAHESGSTVARPLFFEFPQEEFYDAGDMFLWGGGLLIVPVLKKNAKNVVVKFPDADWFDFKTGEPSAQYTGHGSQLVTLPTDLNSTLLFVRGGFIIPTQLPSTTTAASRKRPFVIVVALDMQTGRAEGELYLDDGESLETPDNGKYSLIHYIALDGNSAEIGNLTASSSHDQYDELPFVGQVRVYGLKKSPTSVKVDSLSVNYWSYEKVLTIDFSDGEMKTVNSLNIAWLY
eukprot:m.13084 g.13084  ORF g.13084 m.13084 type:complete len:957 (+) comp24471_c0_seq2:156-3026(+)